VQRVEASLARTVAHDAPLFEQARLDCCAAHPPLRPEEELDELAEAARVEIERGRRVAARLEHVARTHHCPEQPALLTAHAAAAAAAAAAKEPPPTCLRRCLAFGFAAAAARAAPHEVTEHVLCTLRLPSAALATHDDGLILAPRRGAAVRLLGHRVNVRRLASRLPIRAAPLTRWQLRRHRLRTVDGQVAARVDHQ